MSEQKANLSRSLALLLAAVIFWPPLCAFSWVFLPPLAAFLASVLVSWGMVLITWPAIRILCLPNLFLDQPRTRSPQTGVEASRTTLAGLGSLFFLGQDEREGSHSPPRSASPDPGSTFAAGDMDSGHCPPGYGFSLGGGGRELPAARMEMREQQALREAGFTVVSLPAPGRGEKLRSEPRGRQCPPPRRRGRR